MIVNCPACSASYKIDPAKITGRGAKITCPRCGHKFVVYKEQGGGIERGAERPPGPRRPPAPKTGSDILDRDFRRVGITWRVRQGVGVTYSFYDLRSVLRALDEGRIQGPDSLSYDSHTWVPIDSIDDLELYFRDTWRRGERGEIGPAVTPSGGSRGSSDEDEEGPTTIMGHGSALMDDIRRAVAEATTPPPSPKREPIEPSPRGRPIGAREHAFDDPTTFSRRTPPPRGDRTDTGSDGPTRIGPGPQLGAVGRAPRPLAAAPQPLAIAAPTALPAPPAPAADNDNALVLVVSIVGLVLVAGMLVFAAWYSGVLQLGSPPPALPSQPVQNLPGAPTLGPGTDAPPAAGDAAPAPPDPAPPPPAPTPRPSSSQLVPGDPAAR
jgi:predicted Zn finger-like uncharacterized protein